MLLTFFVRRPRLVHENTNPMSKDYGKWRCQKATRSRGEGINQTCQHLFLHVLFVSSHAKSGIPFKDRQPQCKDRGKWRYQSSSRLTHQVRSADDRALKLWLNKRTRRNWQCVDASRRKIELQLLNCVRLRDTSCGSYAFSLNKNTMASLLAQLEQKGKGKKISEISSRWGRQLRHTSCLVHMCR